MTVSVSGSSVEAAGSLIIMGAAGVIALASGLAFLATPLLIWALEFQEGPGWWGIAWLLALVITIFFNITKAIEVLREPTFSALSFMLVASGVVIGACPLWF